MKGLAHITRVVVPKYLAEETHLYLQRVGRHDLEAVALWAGSERDRTLEVKHAVFPEQSSYNSSNGLLYTVNERELHRLNVWLFENQVRLIAQIHSHPHEAYHSSTDDAFPIATTAGCFSLVVPNFARGPCDFRRYAIYRLSLTGIWEELSEEEILGTFVLKEDTVGNS